MSTTYKAQAIAHELADRLKVSLALAVSESFDSDQNPLIQLGDALTTGSEAALVKVEPADWPLAKDILGNSALQYTPHVVKLLWEAHHSSTAGFTAADRLQLMARAAEMGCEVRVYESSYGDGVVLADIDDEDKLVTAVSPDAWHPLISQQ